MASKAMVAPVVASASVRSFKKLAESERHTWMAPAFLNRSSCSCLRTMFTRAMPSARHKRFSICPRLDAAAVCTNALCPSRRIVPTMPKAVSGLTKHEAPSAAVVPGGNTKHWFTLTHRYWEYMAPPSTATFLPISACAAAEDPASVTVPAPSLPTGMEISIRAAMACTALALSTARQRRLLRGPGGFCLTPIGIGQQEP